MLDKIAIIGRDELVFPLRAAGFKVYLPQNADEVRKLIKELKKEGIVLCLLHESFLQEMKPELEAERKKAVPVIAGFSDYRTAEDVVWQMLRRLAVRAVGSDSLLKKRGANERG